MSKGAKFPTYKVLDVAGLIPYARNSRTHSDAQVAQIAASIREFGFTNPVLVDSEGGIIAGHGRVLAARKLGLDTVPVIELTHLSETQKRAYVIADNKLALNAGWDDEMLRLEIAELSDADFDVSLLGFSDEELALMEPEKTEGLTDEDAVPEVPMVPVTALGDVWLLGKHRLMCGDSTSIDAVDRLMGGEVAGLLHADPPYGMGKEADGVANDNIYAEKLDKFHLDWWRAFRPRLSANASVYIWGNAPDLWRLWWGSGLSASEPLTIRNEIVWRKQSCMGQLSNTNRSYAPAGERCLFFIRGEQGFNTNAENYFEGFEPVRAYLANQADQMNWSAKDVARITGVGMFSHWFTRSQFAFIPEKHYSALKKAADGNAFDRDYEAVRKDYEAVRKDYEAVRKDFYDSRAYFDNTHDKMTDVWDFESVTGAERLGHATPKPVAMMERVMCSSLPAGGLSVEPFGGSGSTLMGAEKTGRVCYSMELQPIYCDVIVKRWQDFTGKQATLESDGRTFTEVAGQRVPA